MDEKKEKEKKIEKRRGIISFFLFFFVLILIFLFFRSIASHSHEIQDFLQELREEKNISHHEEKGKSIKLVRVVDGDTIIAWLDGKRERMRLIGIDAPESVKPNSPVECFGKEASKHLRELLNERGKLSLRFDDSQGRRDRFGRLLVYLFLNGKNINEQMISDGYAYEYTYRKSRPYIFHDDFLQAQREAETRKRGLWADGVCVGGEKYKN